MDFDKFWGNWVANCKKKKKKSWFGTGEPAAVARYQEKTKAATLPSRSCASVPGTGQLQRRMGLCKMEDCTLDSFELLYSGTFDKLRSHKSNLHLSKFQPKYQLYVYCTL